MGDFLYNISLYVQLIRNLIRLNRIRDHISLTVALVRKLDDVFRPHSLQLHGTLYIKISILFSSISYVC